MLYDDRMKSSDLGVDDYLTVLDALHSWMEDRGWFYDPSDDTWSFYIPGDNPRLRGDYRLLAASAVKIDPLEVFSLILKLEGEIPWFAGLSPFRRLSQ